MARGNGLGDAYTATLARLKGQKRNKSVFGMKVLMWVLYSQRPLRGEELCHALAVEMGSRDLDPKNIPVLRTLVSSCLGLVTVEESSSTVRLVHFTLQEHLLSSPTLFHNPHSTIAEVCLTYLNFRCIRDLPPPSYLAPLPTMPLLEYASFYWGEHARMGMTENVRILALKLLDRFDKHVSAEQLLSRCCEDKGFGGYSFLTRGNTRFTALNAVSFFGIVEIVATILERKECDVNATDDIGSTALIWASREGHEEVVKMLLGWDGVNPNQADTMYGETPLSWAAERGHDGVVNMLLAREEVNPNQADTDCSRTPLLWAAANGHEAIVKMLLEREEVNPDQADTCFGRTPISLAAERGHEGVVKMLLERVNLKQADTHHGRTPLSWAAERGHERIVKILLEREEVDPDRPDTEYARTPLSWAAERGHEGVVKMLLEREEVNPDHPDTKYGRTPISWAAVNGHEGIVEMLLAREVNPDQPDTDYCRALRSRAVPRSGFVEQASDWEDLWW